MSINSNRLNDWKDFVMTRLTIDATQKLTFAKEFHAENQKIYIVIMRANCLQRYRFSRDFK